MAAWLERAPPLFVLGAENDVVHTPQLVCVSFQQKHTLQDFTLDV
jgi:hypothetical protein